ncbi:MAG: ATP synthase F1 subunit delta [Bdellovibrio sp.]|nr:MAG: ATP synthase F1 subunit delta [Bdellovibrio sp.]
MKCSEIGSRYATALYEASVGGEAAKPDRGEAAKADRGEAATGRAATNQAQEAILIQLRAIAEVFERNREILDFFAAPSASWESKEKVLRKTFESRVSSELVHFLLLLNEKGRMGILADVTHAFENLIDQAQGVTRGFVRSASVIDAEQMKRLEETVRKVIGKRVIFKFEVDPSLAGGLVAEAGGWTFNDSLVSHLTTLREDLGRKSGALI